MSATQEGDTSGEMRKVPSIPLVARQSSISALPLRLEFSGGAELLVGKEKVHDVKLRQEVNERPWTIQSLLPWIVDNLLTVDNPEMLIKDGSVRPGILVLVNDTDWQLLDGDEYLLQADDRVTFISTLHGG